MIIEINGIPRLTYFSATFDSMTANYINWQSITSIRTITRNVIIEYFHERKYKTILKLPWKRTIFISSTKFRTFSYYNNFKTRRLFSLPMNYFKRSPEFSRIRRVKLRSGEIFLSVLKI